MRQPHTAGSTKESIFSPYLLDYLPDVSLCTERALAESSMFAGQIGEKVVMSDHPILAVDGEQILFAFDNVDDATGFLLREATDTATIFKHNGKDWDKVDRSNAPQV